MIKPDPTAPVSGHAERPGGRPFIKMHGLRNHFVIVDGRETPYRPDTPEIVRLCDGQIGVGADQLVVIEPPRAAGADAFMRLYNVDGREVEACGNATRCVAWLLMEEADDSSVAIETLAGVLECRRNGELAVSCDMGRISADWREVPLAEERDTLHLEIGHGSLRDGVATSVGNPHVTFFVDDVDAVDLVSVAPAIQRNPLFPEEVNVGVARIADDGSIQLRVYERGAGLTQACGSGACAAAFAARARGLIDHHRIRVMMPAGAVEITLAADDRAVMSGPVAYCFRGVW